MSDKLSGLDKLIMEMMLQEKNLPISIDLAGDSDSAYDLAKGELDITKARPFGAKDKDANVANLKALMSLDDEGGNLSAKDFEAAFDFGTKAEPKSPPIAATKAAANIQVKTGDSGLKTAINKTRGKVKFPKAQAGDFEASSGEKIEPEDIEKTGFSYPRVYSSLANSNAGKFLGSQNDLINSIFSQNTMQGRLKELARISEMLQNPRSIAQAGKNPKRLLEYTMMVELVDYLFNQIDERAKGGFLESFLALLVGGKVIGSSGGVADFMTNDGQKGSAKFYSNYSQPSQATKGFDLGEPVHYVIAIRKGAEKMSVGKMDEIDLYYIVWTKELKNIKFKDHEETKILWQRFVASDAKGRVITKRWAPHKNKGTIKITKNIPAEAAYIGTVKLGKPSENFIDALNAAMEDKDTDAAKAYKASQNYFKQLFQAEERAKEFIAFKEPKDSNSKNKPNFITKGNDALAAYSGAKTNLDNLLTILSGGSMDTGKLVGENKKKLLDKLIEEVILSTTMEEE